MLQLVWEGKRGSIKSGKGGFRLNGNYNEKQASNPTGTNRNPGMPKQRNDLQGHSEAESTLRL